MLNHFLRISHLSADEGREILDRGRDLKIRQTNDIRYAPMAGKTLAMIFEKPSTRTRVSFETGIYQLGGQGIYLSSQDIQLSRGESVADTARTLSGYVDMVMIRAFSQDMVEELAEYSSVPVINGLTDLLHPCQVMSDVFTVLEVTGKKLDDLEVVYVGDGNNLANSWINAACLFGFRLTLGCPKELGPDEEIYQTGKAVLEERLNLTSDPREAVVDADIIYTDTWVSMGEDEKRQKKISLLKGFQVNDDLLKCAPDHAKIMHCLPAHRGEEITDRVMDGEKSVVFLQAHNRLHVQKAIMDILNQRREEAK